MNNMNPMQSALKSAGGEFDSFAAVLNYLGETNDDQGLQILLLQLSDRAVAALAEIKAALESSEVAHEAQVGGAE